VEPEALNLSPSPKHRNYHQHARNESGKQFQAASASTFGAVIDDVRIESSQAGDNLGDAELLTIPLSASRVPESWRFDP
jgi:hypothetical protein